MGGLERRKGEREVGGLKRRKEGGMWVVLGEGSGEGGVWSYKRKGEK